MILTTVRPRILLLDDDPDYHALFREYLLLAPAAQGYELDCHSEPKMALRALVQGDYLAAFIDYRLRLGSGLEFIHQCQVARVATPLILLTGYDSADTEREALAVGAFDYLSKDDIKPTMLSRRIRHAVRMRAREAELRAAIQQAQAAAAAKTEFLGNMSHEMRTPLNGIIGFSEIMLMHPEQLSDKVRGYVENIRTSGHRLLELVEGLLVLAEGATPGVIRREEVDVPAFLIELCRRQRAVAEARKIAFNLTLPDTLPLVMTNPETLSLALRPIVSNAVKFSASGGSVTVAASVGEDLAVTVRDTGQGMTADEIARATDAFFHRQSEQGMVRNHEGAGIGLTVARAAIEALGGRLAIDSVPGAGTTVTVTIPMAAENAQDLMAATGGAA